MVQKRGNKNRGARGNNQQQRHGGPRHGNNNKQHDVQHHQHNTHQDNTRQNNYHQDNNRFNGPAHNNKQAHEGNSNPHQHNSGGQGWRNRANHSPSNNAGGRPATANKSWNADSTVHQHHGWAKYSQEPVECPIDQQVAMDAQKQHQVQQVREVLVDWLITDPARLKEELFNPGKLEEVLRQKWPVTETFEQNVTNVFRVQLVRNFATALEDVIAICFPDRKNVGWNRMNDSSDSTEGRVDWRRKLELLVSDTYVAKDWMANIPTAKCDHWLVSLVVDNLDPALRQFVQWSLNDCVKGNVTVKQLDLHLRTWIEVFDSSAAQIYAVHQHGEPAVLNEATESGVPYIVHFFASEEYHAAVACSSFNDLYCQNARAKLSHQGYT